MERTNLEILAGTYSDLFKDVHGFRPRGSSIMNDEAALRQAIEGLSAELELILAQEKADQAEAIEAFEASISNLLQVGAPDRTTAIRWLMEAEQVGGDTEYFCYLNQLPYGYLKEVA